MNANAETMMLTHFVRGLRRAFEKEKVALQSIAHVVQKEHRDGRSYMAGVDMGAFAASGVAMLENQVQTSLLALEEILYPFISEEVLGACRKPLLRIGSEDHFIDVLVLDMKTLDKRVALLEEFEHDLLARDPEEISAALPEHVRKNIAETVERELEDLGRS